MQDDDRTGRRLPDEKKQYDTLYKPPRDKPLPDIAAEGLRVLFVGFNPGMRSAQAGHHYAGSSNRFWRLLHEAGLTPYRLAPEEDLRLLEFGFGSTNIADRPTRQAEEVTGREFSEGSAALSDLILGIKPQIVCYVGFGVYRILKSHLTGASKSRLAVSAGLQPDRLFPCSIDFVCSNPSGLNTIPYEEQLGCFISLKSLL